MDREDLTYRADGGIGVRWDIVHDVLSVGGHDVVVDPDVVLVVVAHIDARVLLARHASAEAAALLPIWCWSVSPHAGKW